MEESARHKLVNLRVLTALTGYLLGPDLNDSYKYVFSNSDLTRATRCLAEPASVSFLFIYKHTSILRICVILKLSRF